MGALAMLAAGWSLGWIYNGAVLKGHNPFQASFCVPRWQLHRARLLFVGASPAAPWLQIATFFRRVQKGTLTTLKCLFRCADFRSQKRLFTLAMSKYSLKCVDEDPIHVVVILKFKESLTLPLTRKVRFPGPFNPAVKYFTAFIPF